MKCDEKPTIEMHIKLRMHLYFSWTEVASYIEIANRKPPEESKIVTM